MSSSSSSITGPIPPPRGLPIAEPSPASQPLVIKYRGATVEDLQLSPAVCVGLDATVGNALDVAFDHEYGQLPVLSDTNGNRRLSGYLDVKSLREAVDAGKVSKTDSVKANMVRFSKQQKQASSSEAGKMFTLITPETGLGELEAFLNVYPFALVTDASRNFVLAVATREDLAKYAQRRGMEAPQGNTTPTQQRQTKTTDVEMADASAVGSSSTTLQDTVTSTANTAAEVQPMSRREEEEKRKDRTLAEFLRMLDGYRPLIPDEVTDHYLEKVGFECEDVRLKRLLSLAAEKFVADIAADAFQYARIRTNAGPGARSKGAGNSTAAQAAAAAAATAGTTSSSKDRSRTVLTMDDLGAALGEYGVNARRADFYR